MIIILCAHYLVIIFIIILEVLKYLIKFNDIDSADTNLDINRIHTGCLGGFPSILGRKSRNMKY